MRLACTSTGAAVVVGALLGTPGCGDGEGGEGGGDLVCCAAECVSTLGGFQLKSGGDPVSVSGTAVVTDVATSAVLIELTLDDRMSFDGSVDEALLALYEDSSIEIRVEVDADGYAPYSETFTLPVASQQVCCSTCISASGGAIDLELDTGTFSDGCYPGGGDPACPLTLPTENDTCSDGLCCNYDTPGGVVGCICGSTGWTCVTSACGCSGG